MIAHSEMTAILTSFAASYQNFPVTEARVEAWLLGCSQHALETLKAAAVVYIKTEKWPPTPADVNRIISEMSRPACEQITAGEAWGLLMDSISRFGSYRKEDALEWFRKNNPRLAHCIAIMGWKEICMWQLDDEPANRAHFWKVFAAIEDRDHKADLLGLPRPTPLLQVEGPTSIKNSIEGTLKLLTDKIKKIA